MWRREWSERLDKGRINQQGQAMTQKEFDGLPGLLSRKEFLRVTGLNRYNLRELVLSGEVKVVRMPVKGKYRKLDAARLMGLRN